MLQHLESLKGLQPKPYFEIFSLASTLPSNSATRKQLLQAAINSCPNDIEMAIIELWKKSDENENDGKPPLNVKNYNDAIFQLQTNNFGRAGELFDQVLRQQPNDAHAWYFRALTHYRSGELFAAEAKVDRALELDPELVSALLLKINILTENKNFVALSQVFSRPVSNGPNFLFDMLHASFLIAQNNASEAINVLENGAILLCPGQTSPLFLLGDAYATLKQTEKARQYYLKTQQINPFESSVFEEKMRMLGKK